MVILSRHARHPLRDGTLSFLDRQGFILMFWYGFFTGYIIAVVCLWFCFALFSMERKDKRDERKDPDKQNKRDV